MISWKHSFKRLNEEYEIAKKKRQALDNLFETGRISQSTRDSFNSEIDAAIAEIEKQQKELFAKMQLKMQDLESQIKTLETLLANYEIQHVVGEIDEEIYQHEIRLLTIGLETAKHELAAIKEAANQLCPSEASTAPVSPAPITEPSPPSESETAQNQPLENVPIASAEVEVAVAPDVTAELITAEPAAIEPTATELCPPEPVAIIEEATPTSEQSSVENEVVPAETPQTAEEISQEPVIPLEEVVPEQPSTESADAVSTDVPQVLEDMPQAIEDAPQEAHPQEAPQEAQQEVLVEPIAEQTQCAEETQPAEEATVESAENQGEA